jgi:hypothetical protein
MKMEDNISGRGKQKSKQSVNAYESNGRKSKNVSKVRKQKEVVIPACILSSGIYYEKIDAFIDELLEIIYIIHEPLEITYAFDILMHLQMSHWKSLTAIGMVLGIGE